MKAIKFICATSLSLPLIFNVANANATVQPTNAHSITENNNLIAPPAYTTIISAQQIHDNHYKNIAEALSYANGVIVSPGSINTTNYIVRIDGDDRVAILVDGIRVNLDKGVLNGSATYDLDLLPSIINVEKIEIVHGAVGSNAINFDTPGGVINIITKKGNAHETTVDLATGDKNAWKAKAITSGSGKNWSWRASGGFDSVDYMKYKGTDDNSHEMSNSDNDRREMSYRIDRQLTDNSSLTFTYNHLSNDNGMWFSRSNPLNYDYEKLINHFSLTYDYKQDTVAPGYITYYHNYTQGDTYNLNTKFVDQEDDPTFSRWENTVDGLDWHDGWRVSKDHTVTAGLMYRKTSVNNTSKDFSNLGNFGGNYDEDITNTAIYLQSTRRFNKLILTGTSAFNMNSKFDNKYVSNGALSYAPDDKTTIYASLQKIYNMPTLDELYFNGHYLKGNENLHPEDGQKGSLGVRYKLDDSTNLNFNAFIANIDDPIGWQRTGNTWQAVNWENQKKRGIQFDINKQFSDKYSASLGYAYTHTETDYGDGFGGQTDVSAIAPQNYKAVVSYHDDKWTNNFMLTAGFGRDSDYYSGNYCVLDANYNYKISDQWTTYLKLANITNESYELLGSSIIGDVPASGRTALMGMEYNF